MRAVCTIRMPDGDLEAQTTARVSNAIFAQFSRHLPGSIPPSSLQLKRKAITSVLVTPFPFKMFLQSVKEYGQEIMLACFSINAYSPSVHPRVTRCEDRSVFCGFNSYVRKADLTKGNQISKENWGSNWSRFEIWGNRIPLLSVSINFGNKKSCVLNFTAA